MPVRDDRCRRRTRAPMRRRAFNLVELLIALSITAMLLTATMVALDASFMAYQTTTEQASTQTIGRMAMHRMLTMIRSGEEFGPFPASPLERIVESDFIEIRLVDGGDVVTLEWREDDEALYYIVGDEEHLLLEGVMAVTDPDSGEKIPPFTLEYERGRSLFRATIDLTIRPDDKMDVELDGDWVQPMRLVASAQPRGITFDAE
jgi:prepilin-type N-terminal cleavage/methylation domain-containing protein